MESREFRDLLLFMRPEMNNDDLPHRTTVRTAIIETWQSKFTQLKIDLGVRLQIVDMMSSPTAYILIFFRVRLVYQASLWMCGLQEVGHPTCA